MSLKSTIEWTESTWNPVTGCSKISKGCENCYAERMAKRLHAMNNKKYSNNFTPTEHPENLEDPLNWKKPQMIFVVSMGDLFHKDISEDFILKTFEVMNKADWHIFQVLTKRTKRMQELSKYINWTENIWAGTTIEHKNYIKRVDILNTIPAKIKFLSLEPLLSDIPYIKLDEIDWVIAGGESGPRSRPIKKEWVRNIRDMCEKQNTDFFFKQWGGFNKKKNGRELDGKTWDQMPTLTNQR